MDGDKGGSEFDNGADSDLDGDSGLVHTDGFDTGDNIEYHNNEDPDTDPGIEILQQELSSVKNKFNNIKSTHNMKLRPQRTLCYSSYADPSYNDEENQFWLRVRIFASTTSFVPISTSLTLITCVCAVSLLILVSFEGRTV